MKVAGHLQNSEGTKTSSQKQNIGHLGCTIAIRREGHWEGHEHLYHLPRVCQTEMSVGSQECPKKETRRPFGRKKNEDVSENNGQLNLKDIKGVKKVFLWALENEHGNGLSCLFCNIKITVCQIGTFPKTPRTKLLSHHVHHGGLETGSNPNCSNSGKLQSHGGLDTSPWSPFMIVFHLIGMLECFFIQVNS